jgi:hypothetical protein
MKRTPWFDAMKDKPARVGEYEFRFIGIGVRRVLWKGAWRTGLPIFLGDKWRGLAEKP